MQPLVGTLNVGLTPAQLHHILSEAPSIEVSSSCEVLDKDLNFIRDISPNMIFCTTYHNSGATVHNTATIGLVAGGTVANGLQWGSELIRTTMSIVAEGVTASWRTGVWCMNTPHDVSGSEDVPQWSIECMDRLYLLDRVIGRPYQVNVGVRVLDAVRSIVAEAGLTGVMLDSTASAQTVPVNTIFPLDESTPVTWLTVINELLQMISYSPMYCDQDGFYHSEPSIPPAQKPIEFIMGRGRFTILADITTVIQDLWNIPNRWVFIQKNRPIEAQPPTEGDGQFTMDNMFYGQSSQYSRKLVNPIVLWYDASSQDSLVALGRRRVSEDLSQSAVFEVETTSLPIAGYLDVVNLTLPNGKVSKAIASNWELPHDGSLMKWSFKEVVQ